jgi:hypothetical protein
MLHIPEELDQLGPAMRPWMKTVVSALMWAGTIASSALLGLTIGEFVTELG